MNKYLIIAALMTAGVVHAEITETFRVGGSSTGRIYSWSSDSISITNSIDNQLIFTVTAVANSNDTLVTDFSYLGVDSSGRQTDAAANRISDDESVTVTVSYVDPNGVLTGLKAIGFGSFYGNNSTETTVFADASLNSTSLVEQASGDIVDYAASGLDALTKDNTGSWSITASAGNASTESGFGALVLEYTADLSLPGGDFIIEEWNFTSNSLAGVNGTDLIWFASAAGNGLDETGGVKDVTYTVNRKNGYSGDEMTGLNINTNTAETLTISMTVASWDLSRSGGNGEFGLRLQDTTGANLLWFKFADSLPTAGDPKTTLKGVHYVNGTPSYKTAGYMAQGNTGINSITFGVTLDLVNETYTYWLGDPETDDGSAWNSRFSSTYTGSFPGLGAHTIDQLNWAIQGINDTPATAAPNGDFVEFDQIKLSVHRGDPPPVVLSYETWLDDYPTLSGSDTNKTANPDADTRNNWYEYALGGNPTNGNDVGILSTYQILEDGGSKYLEYIHAQRDDAALRGMVYHLATDTDLVNAPGWTNANYTVLGTNTNYGVAGFDTVTNRVPTDAEAKQFVKLIVE